MAANDIDNLKTEFGVSQNITYIKLKSKNYVYRLSIDFPGIIKKYKIDVAHFQYISPLFKTCKEIVTIHDLLFKDFPEQFPFFTKLRWNFFFNRSAKRADLITTVSDYSKKAIIKHYNIPPEKIFVTPNSVSDDFFMVKLNNGEDIKKRYNIADYILFVSRIEPRKNHSLLLRAFAELNIWREYSLVFIGKNDIGCRKFEDLYRNLDKKIFEKIIRLENISNSELIEFYKNASLFVYPSFAEGFGIPPLESGILCTKTLCSNSTAMADFYFFKDNLFDPNNYEEFKQKLISALNNDNYDERLLISETIKEKYNWRNIASSFSVQLRKFLL